MFGYFKLALACVTLSALVAGVLSITCYTTNSAAVLNNNGFSAQWSYTVDGLGDTFKSCVYADIGGTATDAKIGITFLASGKDGEGTYCTCAEWESAAGCKGMTKQQWLAASQVEWSDKFKQFGPATTATAANFKCCETQTNLLICNAGLGVSLSSASLPLVNMATLLATTLVGYAFTARLL